MPGASDLNKRHRVPATCTSAHMHYPYPVERCGTKVYIEDVPFVIVGGYFFDARVAVYPRLRRGRHAQIRQPALDSQQAVGRYLVSIVGDVNGGRIGEALIDDRGQGLCSSRVEIIGPNATIRAESPSQRQERHTNQ